MSQGKTSSHRLTLHFYLSWILTFSKTCCVCVCVCVCVVLGPAPSPAWGTPCPPAQSALGGTQGGRRVLTACSLHSGLYPHYGPQSKMDLWDPPAPRQLSRWRTGAPGCTWGLRDLEQKEELRTMQHRDSAPPLFRLGGGSGEHPSTHHHAPVFWPCVVLETEAPCWGLRLPWIPRSPALTVRCASRLGGIQGERTCRLIPPDGLCSGNVLVCGHSRLGAFENLCAQWPSRH